MEITSFEQVNELYRKGVNLCAGCPFEKDLINFFSEYHEDKFYYMLLGRMRQDCRYYFGYGNRNARDLWAHNELKQISYMLNLYKRVPVAPVWLKKKEIYQYAKGMNVDINKCIIL